MGRGDADGDVGIGLTMGRGAVADVSGVALNKGSSEVGPSVVDCSFGSVEPLVLSGGATGASKVSRIGSLAPPFFISWTRRWVLHPLHGYLCLLSWHLLVPFTRLRLHLICRNRVPSFSSCVTNVSRKADRAMGGLANESSAGGFTGLASIFCTCTS
ncbi:hypothetical protein M408DRAFT_293862 [Serendipita vermifera MAFF 305830]|uniref:Uncharacterized protein n=1 Tax=Serendipita vermifera MAFF 305830 TaxID=933852 RepID=A0A0C2W6R7_SERVB|nr:hypothetical protein M408DRAFT_293862 [Serendipita vermifera MAFF 305830]